MAKRLTQEELDKMIGRRFERLVVLEYLGHYKPNKSDTKRHHYKCQCDCGSEFVTYKKRLISGNTKSCGCLAKDLSKQAKYMKLNNFYEHRDGYMIGVTSKGEEFYFDKEDYDKVKGICWYISPNGYAETQRFAKSQGLIVKLQDWIFDNVNLKFTIDHINGVRYDNRRCNLRKIDRKDNAKNHKVYKNNSSSVSGVSYSKSKQAWQSYIQCNKKRVYLGTYKDINQAIRVREIAELLVFKEFSRRYEELKEKYKDVDVGQELSKRVLDKISI